MYFVLHRINWRGRAKGSSSFFHRKNNETSSSVLTHCSLIIKKNALHGAREGRGGGGGSSSRSRRRSSRNKLVAPCKLWHYYTSIRLHGINMMSRVPPNPAALTLWAQH